ncbi:MAG: hypothetical protein GTN36_04370 [Candidatus Aenigmarchaeota archaeon]|nr:hypothetical protein [Candidatus Aenigmarchaeota archaeon]
MTNKRELVKEVTLQIIEEKDFLIAYDVFQRTENIDPHAVVQFITHNFEDWGLERKSYHGRWVYARDIENIPALTPKQVRSNITIGFSRIEPTVSKESRERDAFDIYKAHQSLKDLGPHNAEELYSSAENYCNTRCEAPSYLNPMIVCAESCEVWKLKNKALKIFRES